MGLFDDALKRIVAVALSLVQQAKDAAQREADKDAEITRLNAENADLKSQLGQEQAEDAQQEQEANQANQLLVDTANSLENLVRGPETPEAPAVPAPEDAPAVATGDQPVEGGEGWVSGDSEADSGSDE